MKILKIIKNRLARIKKNNPNPSNVMTDDNSVTTETWLRKVLLVVSILVAVVSMFFSTDVIWKL